MFLILDEWPASRLDRAKTFLKVFIKEGLYLGNWRDVFSYGKPYGSVIAPRGLLQELNRKGVAFAHNERASARRGIDTVVALRDSRNLRWALEQKKRGLVKRVIAGPVIATLPSEVDGLLLDEAIDRVLFVGPWHRDLFVKLAGRPMPHAKVMHWGIDTEAWRPGERPGETILVYKKNPGPGVFEAVTRTLERLGERFEVIECGRFDHAEYLAALRRSRLAVFLSHSETQGLAMFEAWSADVPTLHYNPGVMKFLGRDYPGASSCPYLTERCGGEFKGAADFETAFLAHRARLGEFRPREFVLQGFTSGQAADNFLDLIGESPGP